MFWRWFGRYELHGLHFMFPFIAAAKAANIPTPADDSVVTGRVPLLSHPDGGQWLVCL